MSSKGSQTTLVDAVRAPQSVSAPEWARVWSERAADDVLPPEVAVVGQGRRVAPEGLRGYRAPVLTGRSHTSLHAPSVEECGEPVCNATISNGGGRIAEHAAFRSHRDVCCDERCTAYFAVLAEAEVIER